VLVPLGDLNMNQVMFDPFMRMVASTKSTIPTSGQHARASRPGRLPVRFVLQVIYTTHLFVHATEMGQINGVSCPAPTKTVKSIQGIRHMRFQTQLQCSRPVRHHPPHSLALSPTAVSPTAIAHLEKHAL